MENKQPLPPKFLLRFFRWFCQPRLHRFIEGDLIEVYRTKIKNSGPLRANFRFMLDIILLFRPGIIRPFGNFLPDIKPQLFKAYVIAAWRNLSTNKATSLINITGLSLGLVTSMLIALWVRDEFRMDNQHNDIDRIFIVTSCEYSGSEVTGSYGTPGLLGEELKKVYPEVEYACNYGFTSYNTIAFGDKRLKLPGNFASEDFFRIFSYPLIVGNGATALKAPESIAISRAMAISFFDSPEKAIGNTLRFENYMELTVTAVFENLGSNVSEKFEYLINWHLFEERNPWIKDFHNSGPTTYLKLNPKADPQLLSAKMREFLKGYDKEYSTLRRLELDLQPFGERYLNSNFEGAHVSGGRIEYVRMFGIVAVGILLIACVNFMNLSTSRSLRRAREVGVRKVVGADKSSLVSQFMTESLLYTIGATAIAVLSLQLLLPHFNLLADKSIETPLTEPQFWKWIIILVLGTNVMAGAYPAFVLSAFRPNDALRGQLKPQSSSAILRKVLVVFQFSLSIVFIIGVIVITQQVNYIHTKHLGYNKNNLIYLSLSGNLGKNHQTFKEEALKVPGISSISLMSQRPVEMENSTADVEWDGKLADEQPTFSQTKVGYDFIKTMDARLLMGRDFSENQNDSANYIINASALKTIGYKDPIGMPLTFWDVKGTIIGVVEDFHFNSLHVAIKPLVVRLNRGQNWGYLLIRTEPGKTDQALAGLEALHKKFNPEFIFAHQFADEEYAYMYGREQVIKQLSKYFAVIAILISCLGLLGLVIYSASLKTKEIGIRKVLGAGVFNVMLLLSRELVGLVLIAAVIACPVAYLFMTDWLSGFEYHIDIQWWTFVVSIASVILIAILTIAFHTAKAAFTNPVESLRP